MADEKPQEEQKAPAKPQPKAPRSPGEDHADQVEKDKAARKKK